MIADDVGLGKTVEAGLVARELLLRRRIDFIVIAAPPAMTIQWKDELEAKFGLSFEIIDRDRVGEMRRLRGFSMNPWATGSRFIISHRLLADEVYAAGLRDVLGEFRAPLGSTKTRHVDLQVIAATHQNLVEQMRDGRFRQDLFYRLAGAVVTIPPLRDRADLQHLINSALRQSARGQSISFSAEAMQALIRHEWPGNIRELRNVIQRAVHFAVDGVVGTDALDAGGIFLADNRGMTGAATPSEHAVIFSPQPLGAAEETKQPARREGEPIRARVAAEDAERQAIAKAIEASGRNPTLCAQMLGLSRATLYRKLKRHGLSSG